MLSGARLQTPLSLLLRLLPKAAIGKLTMQYLMCCVGATLWVAAMDRKVTFTYFAQTLATLIIRVKLSLILVGHCFVDFNLCSMTGWFWGRRDM